MVKFKRSGMMERDQILFQVSKGEQRRFLSRTILTMMLWMDAVELL